MGTLSILFEDSHSQFYTHFLKTYLAEGIVNSHQCIVVDCSESTFRNKKSWLRFLPMVSKVNKGNEQEKKEVVNPDLEDSKALSSAWRYNNLL